MVFNSLHFLLFFPIVTIAFFSLPHRYRAALLLAASAYFYMALIPAYILVLIVTILIDYFSAIQLERTAESKRKYLLGLSLAANLGILFTFKYADFFLQNVTWLARLTNPSFSLPPWDFILPLGLSFHTFQAMSYTIDVYRGKQSAERRLDHFALFVLFFPQLVAGPIERAHHLLCQFREEKRFDPALATSGLRLALYGLFQKMFVADRLAVVVNQTFSANTPPSAAEWLLSTIFFSIQIYCDFCGYSNMAIGISRVLGFRLSENFNRPYFAASILEFWKRWHISLTSWFRDYVYFPLGGNRGSALRHARNVLTVFAVSGLWHGANWTYVVWGLYHGIWYLLSVRTEAWRERLSTISGWQHFPGRRIVQIATTFFFVTIGWIFFRAESLSQAILILDAIFLNPSQYSIAAFHAAVFHKQIWLTGLGITLLFGLEATKDISLRLFLQVPSWLRLTTYAVTILALMNLGTVDDIPFIYFQF